MITEDFLNISVIIYIAIIVLAIVVAIYRPSILGNRGEAKARSILSKLPESDYIVRNDILLNTEHGTSQIDHVVVSVYGIFVIETKNIRGWILGDQYGDEWVKNVYGNKYRFRNPLKQNYISLSKFQFVERIDAILLVVFTPAYTPFGRSFARKKPLLSTKTREVFCLFERLMILWYNPFYK